MRNLSDPMLVQPPGQVPEVVLDETSAIKWITALRWADGERCPFCASNRVYHFSDLITHKCGDCRKRFSIKYGTVFQNSNVPLKAWLHVIWLVTCSDYPPSAVLVSERVGITRVTANRMLIYLKQLFSDANFKKVYAQNLAASSGDRPVSLSFEAKVRSCISANFGEFAGKRGGKSKSKKSITHIGGGASNREVRERIFEAARHEVSTHGPIRARVDRIVHKAQSSSERLYAYFKNKDDLITAVVQDRLRRRAKAAIFDINNLAEYTGELFDFYISQPDAIRLAHWLYLGEIENEFDAERIKAVRERISEIERGQRAGLIDANWEPATLLNLLASLASSWASAPMFMQENFPVDPEGKLIALRREQIVEAARRIIGGAHRSDSHSSKVSKSPK